MDDLDDVLARARNAYGPDPEAKARIRGALSAAVGGAALASAGTAKAVAVNATAAKSAAALGAKTATSLSIAPKLATTASFGMLTKLGVVAALAGGSVVAYGAFEDRGTPLPTPATHSVVVPAPRVEARVATRTLSEIAAPEATAEVATEAEPALPATHPTSPLPRKKGMEPTLHAPHSTLKDELSLIRRATEELRSGQPSDALATLTAHRQRFPNSAMATEREGLGLLARCSLGRTDETRRSAERFAREAGSSPLAAHVRTQCLK